MPHMMKPFFPSVLPSGDRPDLTPEGFRLGGNSVLAATGFAMRNTSEMRGVAK